MSSNNGNTPATLRVIQRMFESNPTVDVCMNARGIKIGRKGQDQSEWIRMPWQGLTANRIARSIQRVTSSYTLDDSVSSSAQVSK